jgi:hypothetical protein
MHSQYEYVNKDMSFKNNFVYNFHESTLKSLNFLILLKLYDIL